MTYDAPRHLYLAAGGVAVALGAGLEGLWRSRPGAGRAAIVVAAPAIVLVYALGLRGAVSDWDAAAVVSRRISLDVAQEGAAAPPGSRRRFEELIDELGR